MIDIDLYYRDQKKLPSQLEDSRIDIFDFLMDFRKDNEELRTFIQNKGSWIEGGTSPDKRLTVSSLIFSFRAQIFVEIGLNSGVMAVAASRALKVTGGKYIGFELRSELKMVSDYLVDKYGYNIEMYWGDSAVTLPAFLKNGNEGSADMVFIDGSHSVKGLRSDIQNSLKLVKEGGLIIIDDSKEKNLAVEIERQLDKKVIWVPGLHPKDTGLCIYQK